MEHEKIFGLPAWAALLALVGAGVAGYLIFFKNSTKSSADQGTTGYSNAALAVMQNPDESATMALQNEQLSLIANNMAANFSSLGTSVNSIAGQVNTTETAVGQTYAAQQNDYLSIYNALQSMFNSINSQFQSVSGQVQGVSGQVQNSTDVGTQNYANNQAYYLSLYQLLQQLQGAQPTSNQQTSGVGGTQIGGANPANPSTWILT